MYTEAEKTIDMREDCACIAGSIGPVDRIDLVFDYTVNWEGDELEGTASIIMFDFAANFKIAPEVKDKDAAFSFHESGMLHLRVDEFQISALDFPITIHGSKKDELKIVFSDLFAHFFDDDVSLDAKTMGFIEQTMNDSILLYD